MPKQYQTLCNGWQCQTQGAKGLAGHTLLQEKPLQHRVDIRGIIERFECSQPIYDDESLVYISVMILTVLSE